MFGEETSQVVIVIEQVPFQFFQPFFPFVIGGYQSFHSEWIYVADFVHIDGFVYLLAYIGISGHDVGNLDSCQVERLAGGNASDGIHQELLRYGGERRIGISRKNQFTMNFIRYYRYMILEANLADAYQFLSAPYSSGRIVRVAQ